MHSLHTPSKHANTAGTKSEDTTDNYGGVKCCSEHAHTARLEFRCAMTVPASTTFQHRVSHGSEWHTTCSLTILSTGKGCIS